MASNDVPESTGKYPCYLPEKLFGLNDQDHTSFLADADPDIHFYNTFNQLSIQCNYYLENTLYDELEKASGTKRGVILVPYEYPKC